MRLPYLLNPLYRFARRWTPERIKPTVRGLYNMANKKVTYGRTDIFTALDIEINSRCNLACSYCPVSMYDRGDQYMPEALFRKIIDDVASFPFPYEGRISPHFYNDPLTDDRLPRLMAYARERLPKSEIIIHTNGIALTQQMFRELVEAGITGLLITRHMRYFPKPVIDLLSSEPDAKRYITLQRLDNVGIFERGGEKPVHTKRTTGSCYYVSDEIAIDYRGYVVCTNDFFVRDAFGNVNERSLGDIWWDPAFVQTRERLRSGDLCLGHCLECLGHGNPKKEVVPSDANVERYARRRTPAQIRSDSESTNH